MEEQLLKSEKFRIEFGSWADLSPFAMSIREQVFIQEQNISAEDEWDQADHTATHFIVFFEGMAIATARLLENNSIGRVAVMKDYRGIGVGQRLMQYVIDYAQATRRSFLMLSAQKHAIQFYENLGFKIEGVFYLDCGIPHINMRMNLQ